MPVGVSIRYTEFGVHFPLVFMLGATKTQEIHAHVHTQSVNLKKKTKKLKKIEHLYRSG